MKAIKIISAKYLKDYKIEFTFNNGRVSILDFYSFLSAPNQNPMSSKYLDKGKFRKFEILDGRDISWNRYEMCFPFEVIRKGGVLPPPDRAKIKRIAEQYAIA